MTRCPTCGGDPADCGTPETAYFPARHTCWRAAADQVVNRRWGWLHQNAKPDAAGYLPTDGVTVSVTTRDHDDDFLADAPTSEPDPERG